MGYDFGIADRLRGAGLRVVETDGWRSRGSASFNPHGSVNHHTAGGSRGTAPSLGVVIYGRSDLSGPLCNVLQSREADGNDIFFVIAAGRANHAGTGGWRGLTGNSSVFGLEIEHIGTIPLPESRQRLAARCHAALGQGLFDERAVCQHFEWATPPGRKTDAATHVDPAQFRAWVGMAMRNPKPAPPPPPQQGVCPSMFMIATTEKKYFLLSATHTQQIPDTVYVTLAGMGIPHKENEPPLAVVQYQQALGQRPAPDKDPNWGT
jgi:hypothetical protein